MKWYMDEATTLEIVLSDTISTVIREDAFVDIDVKNFETVSFCILTKEQTQELVDYLLGLLGE